MLALPGVASCSVSVTTGRASITFRSSGGGGSAPSSLEAGTGAKGAGGSSSGARDIVRAVEGLGFGAKVPIGLRIYHEGAGLSPHRDVDVFHSFVALIDN